MLPWAIRFALIAHQGLIAGISITESERQMLLALPIGQFGVLVAAGLIVHEMQTTGVHAGKAVRRWWQRRRRERARKSGQPPAAGR